MCSDHPDLVRAGHRDEQERAVDRKVPRRVQGDRRRASAVLTPRALHAGASFGRDRLALEVHRPNQVVVRVGDPQAAIDHREALRGVELRLGEVAVATSGRAGAHAIEHGAVVRHHGNLMVVGVAHVQAIRGREHLARKHQRRLGGALMFELQRERRAVDLAALVEYADDTLDRLLEALVVSFARRRADDVAGRVDDDARGPRADRVGAPDAKLRVVGHRVPNAVAPDNLPDVLRRLLVGELGGVHADDHELVGEPLFELLQVRNDVDAVDAAVGPEVEQDHLSSKRLQRERCRHVEPGDRPAQLGRTNRGRLGCWCLVFGHSSRLQWDGPSRASTDVPSYACDGTSRASTEVPSYACSRGTERLKHQPTFRPTPATEHLEHQRTFRPTPAPVGRNVSSINRRSVLPLRRNVSSINGRSVLRQRPWDGTSRASTDVPSYARARGTERLKHQPTFRPTPITVRMLLRATAVPVRSRSSSRRPGAARP